MSDFRNEFSFSSSKAAMLNQCPRKLLYYSYESWNGWWYRGKPPKNKRAGEIYAAKHFNTIYSWSGRIVHAQAEYALKDAKDRRKLDSNVELRERLKNRAKRQIDEGLVQARNSAATNPKKTIRLTEIENKTGLNEQLLRRRVDSRINALTSEDDKWHGMKSNVNLFTRAMRSREKIVSVEELCWFTYSEGGHNIKCWLSQDLVMRSKDPNVCVIVDWKTGKRKSADVDQIGIYGLWAASMGWKSSIGILVYLNEDGTAEVVQQNCTYDSLKVSNEVIAKYVDSMRSRLVNGNIWNNEPLKDKFEPTSDPSNCKSCPFQLVCARDGTKPTPLDS